MLFRCVSCVQDSTWSSPLTSEPSPHLPDPQGQSAFSFQAISNWNAFPVDIKSSSSLSCFATEMKTWHWLKDKQTCSH